MGLSVTDVGLDKKSGEHEIKKHAATIHCSNTLSLLQRKITNALLYHAYKELMLKEEHEISIKQLCKLIAYHGNNHAAIKDALKGLLSTVIEWNVVSDTTGSEDWTASSILASVSLKGPICLFAYSPRMKQLLHSPSMFGKVNLMVQSRFKSSYGLALYENCIRYRGLPFTKWFELDIFRKLMGVPPGKYTIFRDFKRRVLDKSVEEVNTYSELIVEPEVFREGRQVTKVRFSLKERAKKTRLGGSTDTSTQEDPIEEQIQSPEKIIFTKLTNQFSLSPEQAQQVLAEYGGEFILEKIAVIESSKNYQIGKVQNIAGYLLSALKNNYQPNKGGVDLIRMKKKEEDQQYDELKELKQLVQQIKDEYVTLKEHIIDKSIHELSADDRHEFMENFYFYAADSINTVLKLQRRKYTRETVIHSPQIKAILRQYALQELADVQARVPTLEEFLQKLPKNFQKAWKRLELLELENNIIIQNDDVLCDAE